VKGSLAFAPVAVESGGGLNSALQREISLEIVRIRIICIMLTKRCNNNNDLTFFCVAIILCNRIFTYYIDFYAAAQYSRTRLRVGFLMRDFTVQHRSRPPPLPR